jgi:alkanesulfonate monooxygenase SsuD/methylene tetrahydromethanopterin reductase-like flavin-dependent oxidoreductase (luciferase family)
VPPVPELPIYLAALGEQSVRLAGELADGWVPFMYPRSQLASGREQLREGAARAGHPERLPRVCPSVPAVVADDPGKAREGAAWFVAFYLVSMGTLYRQSLARQGFAQEVESVLAANTPKFAGAVPSDAERLLEELIVFGTPSQARQRLAGWHTAGAELPILLLRPGLSIEELEFTLNALRPATPA